MLGKNERKSTLRALIFNKSKLNKVIINDKKSNDLSLSLRVNYFGLRLKITSILFGVLQKIFGVILCKNDNIKLDLDIFS